MSRPGGAATSSTSAAAGSSALVVVFDLTLDGRIGARIPERGLVPPGVDVSAAFGALGAGEDAGVAGSLAGSGVGSAVGISEAGR